jgi:hypothetical protein
LDDESSWKCGGTCDKDGDHDCACYLVAAPPHGKQVIVVAEPGDEWKWARQAPGWGTVCLCLHKDDTSHPRLQYDLKAPTGCTISDKCQFGCSAPLYLNGKCGCGVPGNPGCYLVGVPRGSEDIHILAEPGKSIHESQISNNWDVFCMCMS